MSEKNWISKDYAVAWAASFLLTVNFYLLMVSTSGYAISAFGASSALAGFATSVLVLSAIVGRMYIGRRVFRIGCIRVLIIGLVANAVMSVCYLFADRIWQLIAIRIAHGLSVSFASTALFTSASVLIPKSKSGVGMGYFALSTTIGTGIGPMLAAALTGSGNYTTLFILSSAVAVANMAFIPFLSLKNARMPQLSDNAAPVRGLAAVIDTTSLPVATVCGLIYTAYGAIMAFLSVSSAGTPLEGAAGYFFIFYAAGILATRPLAGRVFDRRGENPMMYAGLILACVGMLLTGLARSGPMLLAAAFFVGAGLGSTSSVTLSIGIKYAAPERLGIANATFYIFLDAGLTLGPVIAGLLIPHVGYSNTYLLGAPLALVCIALYYFIHGRSHRLPGKTDNPAQ